MSYPYTQNRTRNSDAHPGSDRPLPRTAWSTTYNMQPTLYNYRPETTEGTSGAGHSLPGRGPTENEFQTMDTDDSDSKNMSMFQKTEELFAGLESLSSLLEQSKGELKAVAVQQQKHGNDDKRAENRQLRSELDKLKTKNSDLSSQLERKEAEHQNALQTLKKSFNDQLGKHTDEKKYLSENMQKIISAKKDLEGLEQKYKEECDKRTELEETIKYCKADLVINAQECEALKLRLQQSVEKNTGLQKEKMKVETELSDCKNRLSRLMGNKLSDNNPDIADLSDKNRPTKLAEKYAELYDNEWTDAFEAFDEHFHKEEKSIEILLAVLKHIKEHCDKSAQDQADKLRAAVMIRTDEPFEISTQDQADKLKQTDACKIPDYINKQLKDLRRLSAEVSMPEIYKSYMEKVNNLDATMVQLLSDERVQPFVKGCVDLCWLMSVQDPPIVFGPEPKIGEVFDTDTYKHYTKTGAYIQFLVWPTLHLHEGGSLLSKGVAQGYGQALRNPGMSSRRERRRADTAAVIKESAADRPQTAPHPQNIDRDDNAKISQTSAGNNPWQSHSNQNYQQQVVTGANTPEHTGLSRTVRDTTGNYSQMQSRAYMSSSVRNNSSVYGNLPHYPGQEEMSRFLTYLCRYGVDSQELKDQLGEKYYDCLKYYNYRYKKSS